MRPCGVSGKPWQPNRASNSLRRLNSPARTQLFPTSAASRRARPQTRSSPRRRYVNLSKFQGPVKALRAFDNIKSRHVASESSKQTNYPSKQINHSSKQIDSSRKPGKVSRLTKPLSLAEKFNYMLKCISEAISKSHWRLSNQAAVGLSLLFPSPSLPFFILSPPLTRSLLPVTDPFL